MNLKTLARTINKSEQYTRKLVATGKIPSKMVPAMENSNVLRHDITQADAEAYIKANGTTGRKIARRADGKSRFIAYVISAEMTAENIAAVRKIMPSIEFMKQVNSKKAKAAAAAAPAAAAK